MTPPWRIWLSATRPRTLAAGVAPVLVGTTLPQRPIDWLTAGACLLGAVLIQIGSNFANDAFDGLKGADTPDRLGPQRAVAAGLVSARAMLVATGVVLALAFLVGLYLSSIGGWPILALGIVSLVCAVAYTGGPFPLAYHGLGDLFVFLFFGLFAVMGSAWMQVAPEYFPNIQSRGWTIPHAVQVSFSALTPWWLIAAAVGFQATGIIAVNNLRDIATDRQVGKRTLAVRLGDRSSRIYIAVLHLMAVVLLSVAAGMMGTMTLLGPCLIALVGGLIIALGVRRARGRELNRYLARSAGVELITAAALAAVLMV